MKRLLTIFSLTAALLSAHAQSGTVTGVITDPLGNLWTNAKVTATFAPTPGTPGPYTWSGGTLNQQPAAVTSDPATAAFSITLPLNSAIVPSGSTWSIVVCPNATLQCPVVNIPVVGNINISGLITTAINQTQVNAASVPLAYNQNQLAALPRGAGGSYYDVTANCLKIYNGATWACSAGGGNANFPTTPGLVYNTSTSTSRNAVYEDITAFTGQGYFATSHNFGDSLTYCYTCSIPKFPSYANWLNKVYNIQTQVNRSNVGVPGLTSNQQDPLVYVEPINYSKHTLITNMIGTNDVAYAVANGVDTPNQRTRYYNSVLSSAAYMLFPPAQRYNFGSSGNVTFSGSWAAEGSGYIGRSSTTAGDTATFSGTGNVLYVITHAKTGNTAQATLTCDGTATGAQLLFAGPGGVPLSQDATQTTRVTLGNGNHTCVIQNAVPGTYGVNVEWAGFLNTTVSQTNSPTFVLVSIPDEYPINTADANYRTQEQNVVNTLNGDGFPNVVYADSTGTIPGGNYNDNVHFNNYGHYLYVTPIINRINTLIGSVAYLPAYDDQPMGDFSEGGANSMGIGYGSIPVPGSAPIRSQGFGVYALHTITTGADNIAIGFSSLGACTTCSLNTAVGSETLVNNNNGGNTAIGYSAMFQSLGLDNVAVGFNAMANATGNGIGNTIVGAGAGGYVDGFSNVFMGQNSGVSSISTPTTFNITQTSLSSGVATYTYTLTSGPDLVPGLRVNITGTTNQGGRLNVTGYTIATKTTGSFTINIYILGSGTQAESGTGNADTYYNMTTDYSNTFIGANTGKDTLTQLNNSIAIGYGATLHESGAVQLGNSQVTKGYMGTYTICISSNTGCTQNGEHLLTYASTITFDPSYLVNTIVLTGDVTRYNIGAINSAGTTLTGDPFTVMICQDSTGGHAFNNTAGTGGTGFRGFGTISSGTNSTAGSCFVQTFVYSLQLGAWMASTPGNLD